MAESKDHRSATRRIRRLGGFLVVLAGFSLPVSTVADPKHSAELAGALAKARGGEIIVLPDGDYGDLTMTGKFATPVTIRAQNPFAAHLGTVRISGSNIILDGVTISGRFTIENADHVSVVNSLGTSWNEILTSSNIMITDNEFTGTLNLEKVTGFRISGNYIHEIDNDLMRVIGGASDGIIENNILWDQIPIRFADGTTTHTDALQMFSRPDGTPHDIVIRGNYIYDDPATGDSGNLWGQGIFLGGPTGGYRNITIEENLVATGSPNAIYISVGIEGNVIRNNTVLGSGTIAALSGDSSGTVIYGNVVKKITAENGATAHDNYFYTSESALFQNGGDGSKWEGFLPKPGSEIDFGSGYGALARLTELRSN